MADGRVVFAARRAPLPLDNGARIRTHHLLTGLAREFETTFVTLEHEPGSPDGSATREELAAALPGLEVVTAPGLGPSKRRGQALSLPRRRSWTFGRYRLPAFGTAIAQAAARGGPCVVHCDDLGAALSGPWPGAVNAYSSHNVESRIARLGAGAGTPARRAFNALEARRIEREELRVWREFDLSLAVSELDAEAMRAGGARRVELCPNGTDPRPPLRPPRRASDEPLRLLFVGSGAYAPYERGLAWLVREVLPRLRERLPAVLDVVGQRPARPVAADGVDYVGFVDSVVPWYERAHAVVVPVFEGSGTRLKMIEAAALGRPLVSTTLGAEGLPLRPGEHYLRADDPPAFADALAGLAERLRARDGVAGMLAAARTAIEPLFWPNVVTGLAGLYRDALARTAAGRVS